MTDTELQEYEYEIAYQRRIAFLKKEKEDQFQAARYMAIVHPEWYWHNYIDQHEKGSEERKRAVFLFALANKEAFGNYYGGLHRLAFEKALEREFEELGIQLTSQNIVKEYTEKQRKGTRKRVSRAWRVGSVNGDESKQNNR